MLSVKLLLRLTEDRENVFDFSSNPAITPTLISKSALEHVRLFGNVLLVPTVQKAKFRNVYKTFEGVYSW